LTGDQRNEVTHGPIVPARQRSNQLQVRLQRPDSEEEAAGLAPVIGVQFLVFNLEPVFDPAFFILILTLDLSQSP
jgi:hypothetical protein